MLGLLEVLVDGSGDAACLLDGSWRDSGVKDRGISPLWIIEIPHFAGTGWAADYGVFVGVTSACLAAARKLSARARWVRIR